MQNDSTVVNDTECWLEPPGCHETVEETIQILSERMPDECHPDAALKALAGDPESAFAVAEALLSDSARCDDGRSWLWVAASLGSEKASSRLALELVGEINSASPRRSAADLNSLAKKWLDSISQLPEALARPACGEVAIRGLRSLRPIRPGKADAGPSEKPESLPPGVPACVVVRNVGDSDSREGKELATRYSHIIGVPLPFTGKLPDPGQAYGELAAKWPWAENVARFVEGQMALLRNNGSRKLRLPPILLSGPPGTGKTTILSRICQIAGLPATVIACGGTHDNGGLGAVTRGWSTARASAPVQAMADGRCANPALILDELDKGSAIGGKNGSVVATALSMISGALSYWDPCLLAGADITNVTFFATANSVSALPEAVRDRFLVLHIPRPSAEHFDLILSNLVDAEANRLGIDARFLPWLSAADIQWLREAYLSQGRSIRGLLNAYQVLSGERAMEESMAMQRPN